MLRQFLILIGVISLSFTSSFAYSEYYNSDNGYITENESNYCSPYKTSFVDRLKGFFVGTPTGYTPQIPPSPYLNSYGPSYMRGYYGSNGWNDHNSYNPNYGAAKVQILN